MTSLPMANSHLPHKIACWGLVADQGHSEKGK